MSSTRRGNLLLWYNAYPEQAENSWELRFQWIARYLCCGILRSSKVQEQVPFQLQYTSTHHCCTLNTALQTLTEEGSQMLTASP